MRILILFLLASLLSCDRSSQVPSSGPTVGRVASADGVAIAYEVKGDREPALVFVHGWAGHRKEWVPQMEDFSDSHMVVTVDLAGHGESGDTREAWTMGAFGEDVAAVVRILSIERVVLIGHSMGTAVILEAAKRLPHETVALIPVDMLHNVEDSYSSEQIEGMVNNFMPRLAEPTRENLSVWFGSGVDSTLINEYIDYCKASSQRGWEESLREVLSWASTEQLSVLQEIEVPVYSINADRPVTDVELARRYVEYFDVRIIEGVGHSIHWEVPDEFNRVLGEVLGELLHDRERELN